MGGSNSSWHSHYNRIYLDSIFFLIFGANMEIVLVCFFIFVAYMYSVYLFGIYVYTYCVDLSCICIVYM